MKVPCPSCDAVGKLYKTFLADERPNWVGWWGQKLVFPDGQIADKWPTVECQSCGGSGWIEQVPDMMATVSIK